MAITARKRRTIKKAAESAKSSALSVVVHVAACLTRPKPLIGLKGEYYSHVTKLFIDASGNLVAEAGCGDVVFVASPKEIRTYADFLNQIVAAK